MRELGLSAHALALGLHQLRRRGASGSARTVGTIAAGKVADIVVLDADPAGRCRRAAGRWRMSSRAAAPARRPRSPSRRSCRALAPGAAVKRVSRLRYLGLLAFLCSRTLSALGFQVLAVCVGWQAYALTHRPLTLGLIGLAQFLPMLLLVFVAGHVADRFDRRRVVGLCQCVQACCGLALAYAASRSALSVGIIYGVMATYGAAKAFEGPSLQAMLPSMVPPELFSRAARAELIAVSGRHHHRPLRRRPAVHGRGAPVLLALRRDVPVGNGSDLPDPA